MVVSNGEKKFQDSYFATISNATQLESEKISLKFKKCLGLYILVNADLC